MDFDAKVDCPKIKIKLQNLRGSLVGTKEQHLKFNKAFLIILFVVFKEFFVAPGVKF